MPALKTSKARISALLPCIIIEEMKKAAELENKTQSYIIERALKCWLQKKLDQDTKALSEMHFDDLPSENEWLSIQPQIH